MEGHAGGQDQQSEPEAENEPKQEEQCQDAAEEKGMGGEAQAARGGWR